MPAPLRPGTQKLGAFLADLGCEQRAEPVPPETNGFMADFDAALMQQILYVPKRQREANVYHDRQLDYFAARPEVFERVVFFIPRRYVTTLPRSTGFALTRPHGDVVRTDDVADPSDERIAFPSPPPHVGRRHGAGLGSSSFSRPAQIWFLPRIRSGSSSTLGWTATGTAPTDSTAMWISPSV